MLARGMSVRGTYRRDSLDIPGVAWYPAVQLDCPEQWQILVADTDAVVHLAALVHQAGRAAGNRWPDYQRVNVNATRVVARACSDAGVRRVVFMSSIAVYGRSAARVDEQSPMRPE